MDEKTFIYQKLNQLTIEMNHAYELIGKLTESNQQLINILDKLTERMDKISSSEYHKNQSELNKYKELEGKINFIKTMKGRV